MELFKSKIAIYIICILSVTLIVYNQILIKDIEQYRIQNIKLQYQFLDLQSEYDYLFDANFKYLGNDILLSKNIRNYGKGNTVYRFTTWDGQSYALKYDNFCTLTCATQFANNIVNFKSN